MKKLLFIVSILSLLLISCDVPSEINSASIINSNPTVDVTIPEDCPCVAVGMDLKITATALDSDGEIEKVVFEINGNEKEIVTNSTENKFVYTWSVNDDEIQAVNIIKAIAYDRDGGSSESELSIIENLLPVITIDSPTSSKLINYNSVQEILVTAEDPDNLGIEEVYVVVNLQDTLTTESTQSPYKFYWSIEDELKDPNIIEANAIDLNGATAKTTIYCGRNERPKVTFNSPLDGEYYNLGNIIKLNINAFDYNQDDEISIVEVEFNERSYVANLVAGTDSIYTLDLPTSEALSRTHQLKVRAHDQLGTYTESSISLELFDDIILGDSFETYDDFIISDIGNYQMIDYDQQDTYGLTNTTFQNDNYTGSFIVFNPSQTNPSLLSDERAVPKSGDKYLAAFSATEGNVNNDWIISEPFDISSNTMLSFYIKSFSGQYGLERYIVCIIDDGDTPPETIAQSNDPWLNAHKISEGSEFDLAPENWENKVYDLSSHQGSNKRVAIKYRSQDAWFMMLDDLYIFNY